MRVHVQNDSLGHPLTLEMEPTDTMWTLEAKIQKRFFFNYESCLLIFDGRNLTELDGSTTLDKSGLKDEASLQVGFKVQFMVRVKAHPYGDLDIGVGCFETIGDLKEKIHKWMGVPVKDQLLEWNNVLYSTESPTLLSCGIFMTTTLRSKPEHILILNPTSKNNESFKRTPKIPMATLRVLNEATEAGLSVKEFLQSDRFRSLPPPIYPEKDDPYVKELQIAVEIPNMPWRFPLMVKPTYTVAIVRDIILHEYYRHDELFGQRYIEKGLFVLFHGRKCLKDDSTLDKCGIRHTDCIQLFEKATLPILIRPPCELMLRVIIRVNCFNTVGLLKRKLQVMTGIPPEKQQLKYLDWWLDDDKRLLADYGIVKPVKYDESHDFKTSKNRHFWNHRRQKFVMKLIISTDESETARSGVTVSEVYFSSQPEPRRPNTNESSRDGSDPTEALKTEVPSELEPRRSSAEGAPDAVEASETMVQRPFKQRRLDV